MNAPDAIATSMDVNILQAAIQVGSQNNRQHCEVLQQYAVLLFLPANFLMYRQITAVNNSQDSIPEHGGVCLCAI